MYGLCVHHHLLLLQLLCVERDEKVLLGMWRREEKKEKVGVWK